MRSSAVNATDCYVCLRLLLLHSPAASSLPRSYVNDAFGTAHRAHASTAGAPLPRRFALISQGALNVQHMQQIRLLHCSAPSDAPPATPCAIWLCRRGRLPVPQGVGLPDEEGAGLPGCVILLLCLILLLIKV